MKWHLPKLLLVLALLLSVACDSSGNARTAAGGGASASASSTPESTTSTSNLLVAGDSLPNTSQVPDAWLDVPREEYLKALRPLLDLPIVLLLPTHGDPVLTDGHAHLARVLRNYT